MTRIVWATSTNLALISEAARERTGWTIEAQDEWIELLAGLPRGKAILLLNYLIGRGLPAIPRKETLDRELYIAAIEVEFTRCVERLAESRRWVADQNFERQEN